MLIQEVKFHIFQNIIDSLKGLINSFQEYLKPKQVHLYSECEQEQEVLMKLTSLI